MRNEFYEREVKKLIDISGDISMGISDIEKMLYFILSKSEGERVILSLKRLSLDLNMVNRNYYKMFSNLEEYSRKYNINSGVAYDFYYNSLLRIDGYITLALDRLVEKSYITYEKGMLIYDEYNNVTFEDKVLEYAILNDEAEYRIGENAMVKYEKIIKVNKNMCYFKDECEEDIENLKMNINKFMITTSNLVAKTLHEEAIKLSKNEENI